MSGEVKLTKDEAKTSEETQEEAAKEPDGRTIVTTEEELEGFRIIRAIVCEVVDVKRVFIRDAQSYCAIILDDSSRKTIARLHFNSAKKYLGLLDAEKNETRHSLDDLDDIYKYAEQLKASVQMYLS